VGLDVEVVPSPFDENANKPETTDAVALTTFLASGKAKAVVESLRNDPQPPDLVIGADTVISFQDKILGKPGSPQGAVEMLTVLSGHQHQVTTGISLFYRKGLEYKERQVSETTRVKMTQLCDATIQHYVASGEPLDKAGSYGIQGLGGTLIEAIEGDYYNVVGFPLHRFTVEVIAILEEAEEVH